MLSTILLLSGLCAGMANADFSIDKAAGKSAIGQVQAYVVSLNGNPDWTNNIKTLEHDVPASIAALVSSDAQSFVELLATESSKPAYLTAVPPQVIHTLTSLASGPLHAVADIQAYATALYNSGPAYRSAFSQLATDIPPAVQSAAIADPIGFLATLVVAPGNPTWVSDIPASLRPQVASALNHALAIVKSDVPAPPTTKAGSSPRSIIPSAAAGTGAGVMGVPMVTTPPSSSSSSSSPSSGGSGVVSSAPTPTGSPIAPFKGGAGPSVATPWTMMIAMRTGAMGAGVMLALGGLFWGLILL